MSALASDRIIPAVAFRLVSVLAFTTMGAMIKLAELRGARLVELLFFRQAFALPVVCTAVLFGPGLATLKTRRLPAHILRTAIGLASMSFMFSAVIMLPLAEATTLQFTVPIFATILGAVVLREAKVERRERRQRAGDADRMCDAAAHCVGYMLCEQQADRAGAVG